MNNDSSPKYHRGDKILVNESITFHNHDDQIIVNVVQIFVGLSLILANGVFLIFIGLNRTKVQWKRYGLVLSHTVADFFLGVSLTIVACIWIPLLSHKSTLVVIIMEALKFCSLTIMQFSYLGLMIIQYLAFKKPLLYRLKLSKNYILFCALMIWIFGPAYVTLKSYLIVSDKDHITNYALVEIFVASSSGLVICMIYLYVLYVASTQRKRYLLNGNAVPLTYLSCKTERRRRNSSSFSIANYKFLMITGIRLIYFILSLMPICVYSFIRVMSTEEAIYRQIGYAYCTRPRHYFLMLWFSRGLVDPIIHLILDSKLLRSDGTAFQSVNSSNNSV